MFLFDDFFKAWNGQWFKIDLISNLVVRHNSCRVRVDKDNGVALFAKTKAGLTAGIVKFSGLANNDRARSNNQYGFNIFSFWH